MGLDLRNGKMSVPHQSFFRETLFTAKKNPHQAQKKRPKYIIGGEKKKKLASSGKTICQAEAPRDIRGKGKFHQK